MTPIEDVCLVMSVVILPVNRTSIDRAVVNCPQIRTGRVLRCVIVYCLFAGTCWSRRRRHCHGLAWSLVELSLGDIECDDGHQDDAEDCLVIVEKLHCQG